MNPVTNPLDYMWPHFRFGQANVAAEFLVGNKFKKLECGKFYSPKELGINFWLKTRRDERIPDFDKESLQFRLFTYEEYTEEFARECKQFAKNQGAA